MKKLLPLLMAVLLLVIMSVPAFATEQHDEILPLPVEVDKYFHYFVAYANNQYGVYAFDLYDFVHDPSTNTWSLIVAGELFTASYKPRGNGVWEDFKTQYVDAYRLSSIMPAIDGRVIYSTFDWRDEDYNVVFASVLPQPKCDGSTCPSTDVDKDNICDDCGLKFVVLRDYDSFTVKNFMNHIGQILTSAVSWVGDVGSTILQQPLLLAFTALPLCGLGIAVFRRLKETV